MQNEKVDFFVSCAPGIEPYLVDECRHLGFSIPTTPDHPEQSRVLPEEERGGILIKGKLQDVYRGNLHLRTASRISVRLGHFLAITFSELRKKASLLPWENYLKPGTGINIHVTCHKSRLYHSNAVAERMLGAINDHFSSSNKVNKPCTTDKSGQLIQVRLVNDQCTVSIDSSGELLHKRGYRQAVAKAPLRETLAAALLLASGWDQETPLLDPFCGSGTIPIEAALLSARIPPGIGRDFAFMNWPGFQRETWMSIREDAQANIRVSNVPICGYDRDNGAIQMSTANAARAGQLNRILFKQQAISELLPLETPGWIVTNPPYGNRVSQNKDLRDLYARFGSILSASFNGWKVGILCNERQLIGNLRLGEPAGSLRLTNGGIPVFYNTYSL